MMLLTVWTRPIFSVLSSSASASSFVMSSGCGERSVLEKLRHVRSGKVHRRFPILSCCTRHMQSRRWKVFEFWSMFRTSSYGRISSVFMAFCAGITRCSAGCGCIMPFAPPFVRYSSTRCASSWSIVSSWDS